jgi:hypothetical protein
VNRQIFEVHAIFLVLVLGMFSVLLLSSSEALLEPSRLSRLLLGGLTIFWGLRLLAQWFYYSPRHGVATACAHSRTTAFRRRGST